MGAALNRDELAGYVDFAQASLKDDRLLVGHTFVRRAMDQKKRRQATMEIIRGRRSPKNLVSIVIEFGKTKERFHRWAQAITTNAIGLQIMGSVKWNDSIHASIVLGA